MSAVRGQRRYNAAMSTAPSSLLTGLAPVIDAGVRILVLGSFAGPPRWPPASTTPFRARIFG
jgi:hypothetical protein